MKITDRYLAHGWFRMYDTMFTTDVIELDEQVLQVHWLRYRVSTMRLGKGQKEIVTRNRKFSLRYKPLVLNDETEALFAMYKVMKPFVGYTSLFQAFGSGGLVFDTMVAEVRDENEVLIATGIFDTGKDSIAGIMNIYHPGYAKYSLGKFLIMAKINYCAVNRIPLYYPGYITQSPSRFDYKLFPDKQSTEVFVSDTGEWVPYCIWELFNNNGIKP